MPVSRRRFEAAPPPNALRRRVNRMKASIVRAIMRSRGVLYPGTFAVRYGWSYDEVCMAVAELRKDRIIETPGGGE